MARRFLIADADQLSHAFNDLLSPAAIHILTWINVDAATSARNWVDANGNGGYRARIETDDIGRFFDQGGTNILKGDTAIPEAVWVQIGVSGDDGGLGIWLSGAPDGTNATGFTDNYGTGTFFIGSSIIGSERINANLAFFGLWSAELDAVHVAALGRGVNPFVMRNDILVIYCPIWGHDSPENEYENQLTMTIVNSPDKVVPNPPVELLENYL